MRYLRVAVERPTIAALLLTGLAIVLRLPTLDQPLVEAHEFRQTQTAYTALLFSQRGIDLLHPELPVFGAPWQVPFEFPLFQAMASLLMDLGMAPDAALRITGLGTFLVTAALVWGLTSYLAGQVAALAALAFFLFSPFGLLWSRTSMMEYLATAGAVGLVYCGVRWTDDRRSRWLIGAVIAGSIAMLVKPTTGFAYFVPVAVYGLVAATRSIQGSAPRYRFLAGLAAIGLVPLALGVAWTAHADAIKAASPATAWMTTSALALWNFGEPTQRLDPRVWFELAQRAEPILFGGAIWLWLALAFAAALRLARRSVVFALLLSAVLPPLVFTNLYFVHDYYLAALAPIIAFAMGIAAAWLWDQRRHRLSQAVAVALAISYVVAYVTSRAYWGGMYQEDFDPNAVLPAARSVAQATEPDDMVAVFGRDWSPSILYYARRQGFMIRGTEVPAGVVEDLRRQGYEAFFACPRGSATGCEPLDEASLE